MKKNDILIRIKNLLNKTIENGCTEAEATSALAAARKLMLKYKIKEKELANDEQNVIQKELMYNTSISWIYCLIDIFVNNFGIMKYVLKHGKIEHTVLFGLETDVVCVEELIKCAYEYAEHKANVFAREYRSLFGSAKGVKQSWFEGFIAGLQQKYNEQNLAKEFSLMIVPDEKVTSEFNEFTNEFVKKERVIKSKSSNNEALWDGYKAGKSFGTTPLSDKI